MRTIGVCFRIVVSVLAEGVCHSIALVKRTNAVYIFPILDKDAKLVRLDWRRWQLAVIWSQPAILEIGPDPPARCCLAHLVRLLVVIVATIKRMARIFVQYHVVRIRRWHREPFCKNAAPNFTIWSPKGNV